MLATKSARRRSSAGSLSDHSGGSESDEEEDEEATVRLQLIPEEGHLEADEDDEKDVNDVKDVKDDKEDVHSLEHNHVDKHCISIPEVEKEPELEGHVIGEIIECPDKEYMGQKRSRWHFRRVKMRVLRKVRYRFYNVCLSFSRDIAKVPEWSLIVIGT